MADKRKKVKILLPIPAAAAAFLSAALTVGSIYSGNVYIAAAGALLAAAAAVMCIVGYVSYLKARRASHDKMGMLRSTAFIDFDEDEGKAYICGAFSGLTGLEPGSDIIDQKQYSDMMEEIISSRHSTENDIYMSVAAEKWIKVVSSKKGSCEFTEITDVTDFISAKNTINSLKNYDVSTGLMTKDSFESKCMQAASEIGGTFGVIHISVIGAGRVSSFAGVSNADEMFLKIAQIIKRYENPHNIFGGRTSTDDFCVLITDTYEEGCRKLADKILAEIKEMLLTIPGKGSGIAKVYCGYAVSGEVSDARSVIAESDFAAFDAENRKSANAVVFSGENYSLKNQEFRRNQVFETIIEQDLIDYHFQPVVNAKTGEIYGYEALMRPQTVDGIKLSPLDVLEIAKDLDMLYRIEHITFWKTLKILSENQDIFYTRKLFINCIPNALLTDDEYEELCDKYSMLFDKLVVEVTEESPVFESAVDIINARYRDKKADVALDDYGSGYSNDSTLLKVNPRCIKIDRSIMMNIDKDKQKQHLVENMISFAGQHEIMVLGEGIETFEELETAIALGVDLIQGYVACRPTAVFMLEIPAEVKNRIISYNLKYRGKVSKTYTVNEDNETVDIVALGVAGFNEISVKSSTARIIGNVDVPVDMKICIDSDSDSTRLVFENINIVCSEDSGVAVSVSCNSDVNAELIGRNYIKNGGIRVPENAKLFINGDGKLEINNTRVYSFGIGGNYIQHYGQIGFGGECSVKISCSGDSVVGIGGEVGSDESHIEAHGGNIALSIDGKEIVAVGSYDGNANIRLNNCNIKIDMGGDDVTAVGSREGSVSIDSLANLKINISGNNCCGMGVLRKGTGSVVVNGNVVDILCRGKNIVGIGTIGGEMESVINAGTLNVRCEGDNATGIGDAEGKGSIRLRGASVTAVAKASHENPIGLRDGKIYVTSGSIETSDVEPLECYSLGGIRLVRTEVDGKNEFRKAFKDADENYLYTAAPTGTDTMFVYLPGE